MRKLTLLVAGLFMLCASAVYGQSRTISGKVVSLDDNEPVIGASIQVKGTTTGTISDVDGSFEIQVSDGAVLVVSYVGLKTTEVVAKKGMVIAMESDAVLIDEVIACANELGIAKSRVHTERFSADKKHLCKIVYC